MNVWTTGRACVCAAVLAAVMFGSGCGVPDNWRLGPGPQKLAASDPPAAPAKPGAGDTVLIPDAVMKTVRNAYPQAPVKGVVTWEMAGIKAYVVRLARVGTKVVAVEDGTLLFTGKETPLQDVPAPAAKAIRDAVGKSTIRIYEDAIRAEIKTRDGKGTVVPVKPVKTVYEVWVLRPGPGVKGRHMKVAPDGSVIRRLGK